MEFIIFESEVAEIIMDELMKSQQEDMKHAYEFEYEESYASVSFRLYGNEFVVRVTKLN